MNNRFILPARQAYGLKNSQVESAVKEKTTQRLALFLLCEVNIAVSF
jgi:hypothetical protein